MNTNNITIKPFDQETQKKVFDIFCAEFSAKIETDNCFLLTDVGQKITNTLKENGFNGAKLAVFRACPEYFIYGYDSEKFTPTFRADALAVVGYETPKRFVTWKDGIQAQTPNLIKLLKKQFHYNEVPLREIEAFLKRQSVSYTDIHELLAEQAPAMEIKELTLGEGHPTEEFLVIHKPDDIPEHIRNRIIWTVKQNFSEKHIVKNTELGNAFRKLDVHYQNYKYLDLTAFIRHFSDIFSIISVSKGERNQVDINVRILHENLNNIPMPELDIDLSEIPEKVQKKPAKKPTADEYFRNSIFEAFQNGAYESLMSKVYMSFGLKHPEDTEIWQIYINAFLKLGKYPDLSEYHLNDWEKAVFPLDLPQLKRYGSDQEQMTVFGFTNEEIETIEALVKREHNKVTNVSALAARIATFSPKASPLPEIMFSIGLMQSEKAVREAAIRNLSVFYIAKSQPENLNQLWNSHLFDISHRTAAKIFHICMEQNKPEYILPLWNKLPQTVSSHSAVIIYTKMAAYLESDSANNQAEEAAFLKEFSSYREKEKEQLIYLSELSYVLLERKQYDLLSSLFGAMLITFPKRTAGILIRQIYDDVLKPSEDALQQFFMENYAPSQMKLFAFWEFLACFYPAFSQWETKRAETIQYYREQIASANGSIEALSLTETALAIFPEEEFFLTTQIRLLEEKYQAADREEPYKDILTELAEKKNYLAVIGLSKSEKLTRYREDIWYQELLLYAYREQMLLSDAVSMQVSLFNNPQISEYKRHQYIAALYEDIFDYFYRMQKNALPESVSLEALIQSLKAFGKQNGFASYQQICVLAKLFLLDKQYLKSAFLYALAVSSDTISETEKTAMQTNKLTLLEYLPRFHEEELASFDSILQNVLTTFPMDEINDCLELAQKIVALDQFETTYALYHEDRQQWKKNYSLSKLLCSSPNYGQGWRLYNDNTKDISSVHFVASVMLIHRAGNTGFPLNYCIKALKYGTAESMPENLLDLSYAVLTQHITDPGKNEVPSYYLPFLAHVKRHNSFQNCSEQLIQKYLDFTTARKEYTALTVEIFKQLGNPELFFRCYLTEEMCINEQTIVHFETDYILPLILHYLKEGKNFTQEQFQKMSLLLDYVKKSAVTSRQKTATLWVEEMVDKRKQESAGSAYFRISFALLEFYPVADYSDFQKYNSKFSLENYCNLLDRWLEINPDYSHATALYFYYSGLPFSKKERERQLHFRYLSNALTKMFDCANVSEATIKNIKRTGKNILPLYFLNNFYYDTNVSVSISEMVEMLEHRLNPSDIAPQFNALTALWKAGLPYEFRDYLVFSVITNYWDQFLMELTAPDVDRSMLSNEAVLQYTALTETPKLNRRILQMLIYAKLAELNTQEETKDAIPVSHQEYPHFQTMAQNGTINGQFYESLLAVSTLSGDELKAIVQYLLALSQTKLQAFLPAAEQLIADKRLLPMLDVLLKNLSHPLFTVLVQMFFAMQEPDYIFKTLSETLQKNTLEQTDGLSELIKNPAFSEKAGPFFSAYLLALSYYAKNDFEAAEKHLPASELCPSEYAGIFQKIKEGIQNRIPLAEIHLKHQQNIPKLSFVEAIPLAPDERYSDLLISFESENRANNEKTLIRMAKKIYYQMHMDNDFTDYPRLIMRWGFLEIEASQNYTHRLALLQELAENQQLMEDKSAYEKDFLDVFEDIFLSCSEHAILKNFEKIQAAGQQIAMLYPNHSIATVLKLLQPVWEDFKLPSKEFKTELSRLLSEATLSRNHNANNRLLQKCYDVIFDYKTILDNKENLKIEILNEDGFISGSVFYTIQNIGFQPVNDLQVVVSVLKGEETLASPAKKYPPLHRKQTLAEEIEIKDFFRLVSPGEELQVYVDVSYYCQENEPRNLQAVCSLTAEKPTYEYSKKTCPDFPIHRMELDHIYTTIQNRNLIMLYGTNGTGKTSLLKMLRDRLALENSDNSHTFTVLLTENKANRPTLEIIKEIMTSFCYYDGADTDTTSVYTQLNTFLKYSDVPEEKQQRILSEYRKYVSCDATDDSFTFSNFMTQLKNLDNKFTEFKTHMNLNFKFYLLWDAFERVISSQKVSPEEMDFKSLIDTFKGEESRIRIVFTGSNKLLEVAEVKNDADLWNIMFRDIDSIKVGNLHYNDFKTIITDPNLLNGGELHFSDEALDYLYQYTNGHVRYSKMFVSQTLDIFKERSVNRRCIYPSDLKIHGSDCESINNEQQLTKNLTAQIFQDITADFSVISVGYTLADMASEDNHPVPAAEVQNAAFSAYHELTSEQFNRAIEILKARDFITEILDKYQKPTYRFTSVLYQQHFLNRDIDASRIPEQERPIEELILEVKKRSYDEVNQLLDALDAKNVNVHIERQYNDNATDQSIGTQNNIQINAQNIAATFNSILTAKPGELQALFASLPMANAFLEQSKQDKLQVLCIALEEKENQPVNIFNVEATKQQQQEQETIREQIAEIIDPAIDEMHITYKNAVVMAEDTVDEFRTWEVLGLSSEAEYELLTTKLKDEFTADLYFAAKLDYLFKNMEDINQKTTDFSPVSIMYCKLIEKMLKYYHTDIYADKLKDASTQNTLRDKDTKTERQVLFGDLAKDSDLTETEIANVRNRIMIGAFLWPINPHFDNRENRAILSDNDIAIGRKWELHGAALNDISRTRNDSAHGSSNKRITQKRLSALKNWLFEQKELQNIIELCQIHKNGIESFEAMQKADEELLKLLEEKYQ